MNPSEVPVIKTKLSSDEKFYPYVVINIFNKYYPFKIREIMETKRELLECYIAKLTLSKLHMNNLEYILEL